MIGTAVSDRPVFGHGMKPLWAFDTEMVFLNQGAFGATLQEVTREQDRWRGRMETQTARFFLDELQPLIQEAVEVLAAFVGSDPARTVMVENVSSGVMAVLNAVPLVPGDRVVTTSQVYGAVRHALHHRCAQTGAELVECAVPVPVTGEE
ncbi:MAG: hypothetical protein WBF53_13525, partial [Litorimonas sp.]